MIEDDDGNAIEPDVHWAVWAAMIVALPFILFISLFAAISKRIDTLRPANGD